MTPTSASSLSRICSLLRWGLTLLSLVAIPQFLSAAGLDTPFRPGDLPGGLVGWWKLSESSGNRADSSGKGNTLADGNTVGSVADDYWVTGEQSGDFERDNAESLSITHAAQTGLAIAGQFTVSGWIKFESTGSFQTLFSKRSDPATEGYELWLASSNELQLIINGTNFVSSATVVAGRWYHIAAVYNGSSGIIYLDGNASGISAWTTNPSANTGTFRLGSFSAGLNYFDGLMKDAAVWDRALTPIEVKSLALGVDLQALAFRPGSIPSGLVSWWKMDEISNGSAPVDRMDSGPGGNHIAGTGSSEGGYATGSALRLNGQTFTRPAANVSASLKFNSAEQGITVACWLNFDGTSSTGGLFGLRSGSTYGVVFVPHTPNQLEAIIARGGSSAATQTPDNALKPGTWQHVALVYDPVDDKMRIIIDGVVVKSVDYAGGIDTSNVDVLVGRNGNDSSNCRVSDLAVWNRALTGLELKSLATGLPVQRSGIVSYWNLDEPSGTRTDSIGMNHLAPSGAVGSVAGMVGNAASFAAASSQQLSFNGPSIGSLNIPGDLTTLYWARLNTASNQSIISMMDDSLNGYNSYIADGTKQIFGVNATTRAVAPSRTLTQFFHGAMVFDGVSARIYKDAQKEIDQVSSAQANNSSGPFRLGAYNNGTPYYFDGLIDEVLVARRSFRDEEVKAIYNKGLNGLAATSVSGGPSVQTTAATAITAQAATLNATVNPNGVATSVHFEWGTTTDYGNTTPSQGAGNGSVAVPVSAVLSGLSASNTYHFRAVAVTASTTVLGADQVFTTLTPPSATTAAATMVTKTTARLQGSVNPNGNAATVFFEYGETESYGTSTPGQNIGSGNSGVPVQADIVGLDPNKTYHYRVVTTTVAGTMAGLDGMFTTEAEPPVVGTGAPNPVSSTGATLIGAVIPNGRPTQVRFEYGTTTLYGIFTPLRNVGSGTSVVEVEEEITGLTDGNTYHYRIIAMNSGGSAVGNDQSFVAEGTGGTGGGATAKPTVTTESVTGVVSRGATLQGTVNANGGTTFAYFEYGLTTSYTTRTQNQNVGSGSEPALYAKAIEGLLPGTTYHFRVVAENSLGSSPGGDGQFTTPFEPPIVTTSTAEAGATFATLRGTVNPNGVATSPVSFQYSTDPTLVTGAQTVQVQGTLSGTSAQDVSVKISGLAPQTPYYYRLVATGAGTTQSPIESFTTLGAQAPLAVDDYLFVGTQTTPASRNLLANDVNQDFPPTTSQGLSFDAFLLDRQPPLRAQGEVAGISGNVTYTRFSTFLYDRANFPPTPSDVFKYRIKTPANQTTEGTVNIYHFGSFKGSYGGVIEGETGSDGGSLTLELRAGGDLTMKLIWQGVDYSRKLQLDGTGGSATAVLKRIDGKVSDKNLVLAVGLLPNGTMTGTLVDEETLRPPFPFELRRAGLGAADDPKLEVFTGTMNNESLVATLPDSEVLLAEGAPRGGISPQRVTGFGFYLARLSKSKTKLNARLVGGMPDQEPFSSGSKVFDDRVLLNAKLYKKGNRFGGSVIGATMARGRSFTSTLEWIKQTGLLNAPRETRGPLTSRASRAPGVPGFVPFDFHNTLDLVADSYQATGDLPAVQRFTSDFGTQVELRFSAGGLETERKALFTLRQVGDGFKAIAGAATPTDFKVTFAVSAATGKFSGTFVHPDPAYTKPVKFSGAFVRNPGPEFAVGEKGRGSFRGFENAGFVQVFKFP